MNRIRTIIFVDHANVFKNLEKVKGRIDWKKLKLVLKGESHLVGAFIYIGLPSQIPKEQKKFIKYLEHVGYVIQPKPLKKTPNGRREQKGVDIFIYKEIVELAVADSYDKAIIVSGDGDFIDAVNDLKRLQKTYEIWSFKNSLSKDLANEAGKDNVHYIDNILEEIKFH
jgi:uncharacterized LabA/DUF88 family protein